MRRRASPAEVPTYERAAVVASAYELHPRWCIEAVLEVELSLVAELHDRRRGEGLRDRADAVLRVRCRLALGANVGEADRCLPDRLAVPNHRRGDAREPFVPLLAAHEPFELGRKRLRR
jgi:hypothetical protein